MCVCVCVHIYIARTLARKSLEAVTHLRVCVCVCVCVCDTGLSPHTRPKVTRGRDSIVCGIPGVADIATGPLLFCVLLAFFQFFSVPTDMSFLLGVAPRNFRCTNFTSLFQGTSNLRTFLVPGTNWCQQGSLFWSLW